MRSLFHGYNATLLRDSVASFFYFSTYEFLKQKLTPEGERSPGVAGTLLAGGSAGMVNWSMALPLDTLKSKLQVFFYARVRVVAVHLCSSCFVKSKAMVSAFSSLVLGTVC